MQRTKSKISINKISFFIIGSGFLATVLVIRLFQLQVIQHNYYQEMATRAQYGEMELPAQRGEIVIKDIHSEEEFLIATNTSLKLLFVDPSLVKDPFYVSGKLAPMLFNIEEERASDNEKIQKAAKKLPPELTEEQIELILKPLSDIELEEKFKLDLTQKISEKIRPQILLRDDMEEDKLLELRKHPVGGIKIINGNVYAYPSEISNPKYVAEEVADYVEIPSKKLTTLLKGENRYVILGRRLDPKISDQIQEMIDDSEDKMFKGLGFQEEAFRYYPEGSLAANIIGYVNRGNLGQYGIESTFNTQLMGVAGKFHAKRDSVGRQITVGESILKPAKDGDKIVLTIDRSIQLQTEKIIKEAVDVNQADSGQILVMNPKNGAIIAMANYPTFDPNHYGDVFKKVEAKLSPEEVHELSPTNTEGLYYFYTNPITLDRYSIFEEKDENGISKYYRYENYVGPEVYHNKIVSWPYEPGSVFKPIAMAIAIDDGDVTPNTTYNDSGPIKVDYNIYTGKYDFEIKNALGHFGLVNMTTVIAKSLNTGMTFVAKQIGPTLFYNYMEKFGLTNRTDIEFDSEVVGKIPYFEQWTESELATKAFGQGMTVTMIQIANAYSVLANGGVLMQPHIVDEIQHDDGTVSKNETHEIRRVISEDTSSKMTAMLVNATENGVADRGKVEGHYIAGKTGTSQTYKHGIALFGKGTTIATFAGYGPVDDPQFVILVKIDRPERSEWGSSTAAPTFSKVAEYIFDYYNIPPDK